MGSLGLACSDSKPAVDARDDEGLQMCCTLGAICHEADLLGGAAGAGGASEGAGGADGDAPSTAEECHWLGHENDPDRCREYYDRCMQICKLDEAHQGDAEEHACE